ncbi:MAG: hypothetical protein ACC634_08430, partial [Hyphomicrobiales bacterium]
PFPSFPPLPSLASLSSFFNARAWRRCLTEGAIKPWAGPELVVRALALVEASEATSQPASNPRAA